MSEAARPVRRRPEDRRAEIVSAARQVFLAQGPEAAALAEVAAAGEVSRGSIYRYFPSGRTDLLDAVVDQLVEELHERMRYAAAAPFSPATRLEHLIGAVFAYFQAEPRAYRFLFRDIWTVGDPDLEAAVGAARSTLTGAIAEVIATEDSSPQEVAAASAGVLGFVLSNVELALAGEVEPETAWAVSCRYAGSQVA